MLLLYQKFFSRNHESNDDSNYKMRHAGSRGIPIYIIYIYVYMYVLFKVLREANTIMRMKRPMIEMEVTLKNMTGQYILLFFL